jgi:hypothetical protein
MCQAQLHGKYVFSANGAVYPGVSGTNQFWTRLAILLKT